MGRYGSKSKACHSLDQLRYDYACKSDKAACLFPPTDDAFEQHVRRVNYQVAIWVQSHVAKPVLWKPDGNGWNIRDNKLEPVLFEKEADLSTLKNSKVVSAVKELEKNLNQGGNYKGGRGLSLGNSGKSSLDYDALDSLNL